MDEDQEGKRWLSVQLVHCLQLERSVTCAMVAGGARLGTKLGFAASLANARARADQLLGEPALVTLSKLHAAGLAQRRQVADAVVTSFDNDDGRGGSSEEERQKFNKAAPHGASTTQQGQQQRSPFTPRRNSHGGGGISSRHELESTTRFSKFSQPK